MDPPSGDLPVADGLDDRRPAVDAVPSSEVFRVGGLATLLVYFY